LLTVFKNFLNDATNVFKYEEITLNANKTILEFLVFFHRSPGTLLSYHVRAYRTLIQQPPT
jgi:hypothetical protein